MSTLKYSKQRETIRDFMCGRTDHPTADTVYMNVRKSLPNISLGTVYRNLMLLTDTGELQKIDVGDGTIHFDPTVTPHCHFLCTACGKVTDMSLNGEESLAREAEEKSGARITGHSFSFRGICKDCLAQSN